MLKQEIWVDGERIKRNWFSKTAGPYMGQIDAVFPEIRDGNTHDPVKGETQPLDWINSAGIEFLPDEDEVRVDISIGSPLGSFVMAIRRLADGRLLMHVPHPDQVQIHLPLIKIAEGTYHVSDWASTAAQE